MKLFLIPILLLGIQFAIRAQIQESPEPGNTNVKKEKSILIINSYSPETQWSEEIVSGLKSALQQQFPNLHIHSGNLNIEEAQTDATTLLSLRAILWQMAEEEGDVINPQSLLKKSLYQMEKKPDVIVFLGEGGLFEHFSLHLWQGPWSKIPIVCCAVNDSITNKLWHPGESIDISDLRSMSSLPNPIISYRKIGKKYKNEYDASLADTGIRLSDTTYLTAGGDTLYATQFHTTGVISEIPVKKNLELLKLLMPKLKEIVWIDNDYYKSLYALNKLRQALPEILPDVKLSVIRHNRINTDSIYDIMLQPVKDRAFITYAWNINGVYSSRPEALIDSLFSNILTSPILTLGKRQIDKNYWLGGVHTPTETICRATLNQIIQLLNGTPVDSIPYINISETQTQLNVPALKRFGLEKRARKIENAIYKNIPPSFYSQHEKTILISVIILIILAGSAILTAKRIIYTRKIRAEYISYEKLYKRLQTVYQNSNINFALYDQNGVLTSRIVNGQESGANELQILPDNLFSPSWLNEKSKQAIREYQTVNEEIELEIPNETHPQGRENKKWNLIIKPLHSASEYNAHYIAISIDLTPLIQERKIKERSERIFQFATETVGIGVASYDLLTGKRYASQTWYHNLNEKTGKDALPTYQNVCEEDRELLLAHRERIRNEYVAEPFIHIIQVNDNQGKKHYVQQYIFVREFNPAGQSISVVELNLNYDEPQQRENALQQAKEKAEDSNLETEQFLANISHEIRTPLNAIVGFSSIIADSTDEEEIQTLSPIIEQNNKLLLALIENILYLSKLDSGTLTFYYTRENPQELFEALAGYAEELAGEKEITVLQIIPTTPEPVNIAVTQFNLVMNNLISNAVKFTNKGTITIGYEKREEEYYFFVKDTGCGIHIVDQENIFKRFNKLDVFTQGTGLGLSLCRSIVTHQGGEISVTSIQGEGSTFWFTVPEVHTAGA